MEAQVGVGNRRIPQWVGYNATMSQLYRIWKNWGWNLRQQNLLRRKIIHLAQFQHNQVHEKYNKAAIIQLAQEGRLRIFYGLGNLIKVVKSINLVFSVNRGLL